MNITLSKFVMKTICLSEKKTVDKIIRIHRGKHLNFIPLCQIFGQNTYVDRDSVSYEIARNYRADKYFFPTSKDFDIFVSVTVMNENGIIAQLTFFLSDYNDYSEGKESANEFLGHSFLRDYREAV